MAGATQRAEAGYHCELWADKGAASNTEQLSQAPELPILQHKLQHCHLLWLMIAEKQCAIIKLDKQDAKGCSGICSETRFAP